jgi:predicted RNA-binding protein YlqC (UPF0109 family)
MQTNGKIDEAAYAARGDYAIQKASVQAVEKQDALLDSFRITLAGLIEQVVDYPNQVEVALVQGPYGLLFTVKVAALDLGKLIGKKGRNVSAFRQLVNCFAAKHKLRLSLELMTFAPR